MEVILLESFDKLGKVGDIVHVKNGFARNFLIPKKKALRASTQNKEHFNKIKNDLIKKNNQIISDAEKIVDKIKDSEIVFIRNAADNGQLYGSVTPKDISQYFSSKKIEIQPSSINLHSAIKKIGLFEINIKLHADVNCKLELNVATSEENAQLQRKEKIETKQKDELTRSVQNLKKSSNIETSISSDSSDDEEEKSTIEKNAYKIEDSKEVT